ncbi:hypothetical protein AGR8A_Cc40354 [Agrobacterium fabrum str. J-07]|nr:hypothetical protein AGR8A_Cc40354 [Agrobacterium fabrum str. J-07]
MSESVPRAVITSLADRLLPENSLLVALVLRGAGSRADFWHGCATSIEGRVADIGPGVLGAAFVNACGYLGDLFI